MFERLAQDWTLDSDDLALVGRARGVLNRMRFALDLCSLRATGAFVVDWEAIPVVVINHVASQLSVPPQERVPANQRRATTTAHRRRIREHLGYVPFSGAAESSLTQWLDARAAEGARPSELFDDAVARLREQRVVLPATSTLERLVRAVDAKMEDELVRVLADQLPAQAREAIDELLEVEEGKSKSELFGLRESARSAKGRNIVEQLGRLATLERFPFGELVFPVGAENRGPDLAEQLRGYDAWDLRRLAPERRYALVACFVEQARSRLLDDALLMNDVYLTGMRRRGKRRHETDRARKRQVGREGTYKVLTHALESIDADAPGAAWQEAIEEHGEDVFREYIVAGLAINERDRNGLRDAICNGYSGLRRYLPTFWKLPRRAESGSEDLLRAIELVRQLDTGEIDSLPANTPYGFVKTTWRQGLLDKDKRVVNRRLWEVSLAFAVRDALRAGDLYVVGSHQHASFADLVYDEEQWEAERAAAYEKLGLPDNPARFLKALGDELRDAARALSRGLGRNSYASLRGDRLKTAREPRREVPAEAERLRATLESSLPHVRLEQVLLETDRMCQFTEPLREGQRPKNKPVRRSALLAALVAHGANLGTVAMQESTEDLEPGEVERASRQCLRPDTLRAANRRIVDFHASLPITRAWGTGERSSSDGQRFKITADTLLASYYPRHFGFYERAVNAYSHTSDLHTVFATRVISCKDSEAIHVLDGLLHNDTILDPREHSVDTHGATLAMFGLCRLLGFDLRPRLAGIAKYNLYKDRANRRVGGNLEPLFTGAVDAELIRSQYDVLVRTAASLVVQTAPAHVVVQRLTANKRSQLARALAELGRLVRTIYILRYLHDPELRAAVRRQLNRGEGRHVLAGRIMNTGEGAFTTGNVEQLANKATALSVLSNVFVCWNTVQYQHLHGVLFPGEPFDLGLLSYVSPMVFRHVNLNGMYRFEGF